MPTPHLTRAQHYREAERLLDVSVAYFDRHGINAIDAAQLSVAQAQVHATLATVGDRVAIDANDHA